MNVHQKSGRYTIQLSNTDKIMLPPKITKGDIIDYYAHIADTMVPYMKDHALMMQRFPKDLKENFFIKKRLLLIFRPGLNAPPLQKKEAMWTM